MAKKLDYNPLKDNDELLNEMNYGDEYHPHFFIF